MGGYGGAARVTGQHASVTPLLRMQRVVCDIVLTGKWFSFFVLSLSQRTRREVLFVTFSFLEPSFRSQIEHLPSTTPGAAGGTAAAAAAADAVGRASLVAIAAT